MPEEKEIEKPKTIKETAKKKERIGILNIYTTF